MPVRTPRAVCCSRRDLETHGLQVLPARRPSRSMIHRRCAIGRGLAPIPVVVRWRCEACRMTYRVSADNKHLTCRLTLANQAHRHMYEFVQTACRDLSMPVYVIRLHHQGEESSMGAANARASLQQIDEAKAKDRVLVAVLRNEELISEELLRENASLEERYVEPSSTSRKPFSNVTMNTIRSIRLGRST